MLKQISITIVLGMLVLACSGLDKPKKPDNLISKDQMSQLLYDLYVINAAKGVNRKTLETNGFHPANYILEHYNIDSTQFTNSNTYYAHDPETYKAIVDVVKARLEKEKETFEAINKRETDSLKKHRDSVNKKQIKLKDSIKKITDSMGLNKINPKKLKKTVAKDLFYKVDSLL